jgi:RecB family exonuclease
MAATTATDLFLDAFEAEVLELVEEHPQVSGWSAAGRGKRVSNPRGEDGAWWRAQGPKMVQAWIDWRKRSGWKILDLGGGVPAIEVEVLVDVAGIPLKAYVDRVMVVPEINELVIVDLKTGARNQESDMQLGFYRLGLMRQFGLDVRFGCYWDARSGRPSEMLNLKRYKPKLLETWLSKFDLARQHNIYLPHITFRCRACPVSQFCAAYGGKSQHMDPDYEGE